MVFKSDKLIRFGHTDPAGIVFYPRYFEMINDTVEDWFTEAMKASFADLVLKEKRGLPTVHTECDFLKPSRLGEVLTFELTAEKIGASSIIVNISAMCAGEERLRARTVLVYADYSSPVMKAVRIPSDMRERMSAYLRNA